MKARADASREDERRAADVARASLPANVAGKESGDRGGDTFVSERIIPDKSSFDTAAPALGEPALPRRFTWRKKKYEVSAVLQKWREHDPDRTHGSGKLYLRKHWFHVRVDDGTEMRIYFERQPGMGRSAKTRWWLYTLRAPR